jgi:hypothetical protein
VLAVKLRTGKTGFNAFLNQAHVPSVFLPSCGYGLGRNTAKHIIIHCRNFSAARHDLRDNQGHVPDYKQLVTTPAGLKKVIRWVIEIGLLGLYQKTRPLLYPLGPSSVTND